jgi:hypothetical protein
MEFFEALLLLVYGVAFIIIIYFLFGLMTRPEAPNTVVIYDETPTYDTRYVWPWYGGYNYWPTWVPWGYGGGYYGGYWGKRTRPGRWHGGGIRPWGGSGRGSFGGAPRVGGPSGGR